MPLIYGEADDAYVIVASRGGGAAASLLVPHLVANPDVSIMVGPEQMEATARTADGTERDKLFAQMAQSFAPYLDYAIRAAGADRQIPVVVLDPKRD